MKKQKNGISYFGINISGSTPNYAFKVLQIGDWNINSSATKSVAHSLSSSEVSSIKNVSVILRDDANTTYYPISSKFSTYSENRFGPTNNLSIFNWSLTNTSQTLDKNYNIFFPQSASTNDNYYVNNTYSSSGYNGFNYTYVIPTSTSSYKIDFNIFLNLQMYHSYPTSAAPANKNPATAQALFCDVIVKQGSTTLNTSTYNLGNLPSVLQGTSNRTNFYLSSVESVTASLNNTQQLYVNIRFYTTSSYVYIMDAAYGGAAIATNYNVITLSTSGGTQSYFENYIGQNSIISDSNFNLRATSFFKSTNFDSTSYNRGWISFFYEPSN